MFTFLMINFRYKCNDFCECHSVTDHFRDMVLCFRKCAVFIACFSNLLFKIIRKRILNYSAKNKRLLESWECSLFLFSLEGFRKIRVYDTIDKYFFLPDLRDFMSFHNGNPHPRTHTQTHAYTPFRRVFSFM